jgi:hypothetical protein
MIEEFFFDCHLSRSPVFEAQQHEYVCQIIMVLSVDRIEIPD